MSTYVKIETITVGSGGAASITFSSIPQTYTDLILKLSLRDSTNQPAQNLNYSFNSSTSGFTGKWFGANGSSTINGTWSASTLGAINAATSTASTFGNMEIYIPNYAGSNYKPHSSDSVTENSSTTAYQWLDASLWSNTAAITSISFANGGQTFSQYSSATLYGIKKD